MHDGDREKSSSFWVVEWAFKSIHRIAFLYKNIPRQAVDKHDWRADIACNGRCMAVQRNSRRSKRLAIQHFLHAYYCCCSCRTLYWRVRGAMPFITAAFIQGILIYVMHSRDEEWRQWWVMPIQLRKTREWMRSSVNGHIGPMNGSRGAMAFI